MTRRLILVLEDAHERVDWLRTIFSVSGYKIEAHTDVAPFVEALKAKCDEVALVIFDHDLGSKSEDPPESGVFFATVDSDGKTGADAARAVGAFDAPALVWSWNPDGARAIGRALKDGNKASRIWLAPFTKSAEYAVMVAGMISKGKTTDAG